MALKEAGCYKRITASGGGTLVAAANESLRITDIFCAPSTNDTYLTLNVDGRVVNMLRVKGKAGNHLPYPHVKTTQLYEAVTGGLLGFLRRLGFDMSIPIGSGETLTVSRYAETGDVTIKFDKYDAGDVKPDEPNGSGAKVQRYLHYVTNTAAITTTPTTLATSLIWTGGDQWPVSGNPAPEGASYNLAGILGSPMAHGNNTINKGCTTYLLLQSDGDLLFDGKDLVGIPFGGVVGTTADAETYSAAYSVIGPLTAENPSPPLILVPPVLFKPGATLTIQVATTGAASAGIGALGIDLALMLERIRA
jgi:hypothetical protein